MEQPLPFAARYVQIREALAARIRSGELAVGDQVPTESQLASQYGCSRTTVIRAVRDLAQAGLLVRVQGKGTFVADRSRQPANVLVLVSSFREGFRAFGQIAHGVKRTIRDTGYRLQIEASHNEPDLLREIAGRLAARTDVAGVLMVPLFDPEHELVNQEVAWQWLSRGLPFVVLDHRIGGLQGRAPFVGTSDRRATREMVAHLLRHGHTRIAYLRATGPTSSDADRFDGYLDALAEAQVPRRPEYEIAIASRDVAEQGIAEVERLMAPADAPSAIVCAYDAIAVNAIRTLARMGYAMPRDIAVTGFGDDFGAAMMPSLTTAEQLFDRVGKVAAQTLVDMVEGRVRPPFEDALIPSIPIFRESTASDVSFVIHRVPARSTDAPIVAG